MTERSTPFQAFEYPGAIILSEAVLDPEAGRTVDERTSAIGVNLRVAAGRSPGKYLVPVEKWVEAYAGNPAGDGLTFEFHKNRDVIVKVNHSSISQPDDTYAINRAGQNHLYLKGGVRKPFGEESLNKLISQLRGATLKDLTQYL